MLSKIKDIKNFAVFKNFLWDNDVKDKEGNVVLFKKHNIIYGRNYSGKTSLSRIVRAVEQKEMPPHYDRASFTLEWEDKSTTTDSMIGTDKHCIRVFNEDFIRENLAFISNADDSITSFAVIGEDNVRISSEIDNIQEEIGEEDATKGRTKLFAKLDALKQDEENAKNQYQQADNKLQQLLSNKAIGDRQNSIKYNPSIYGDQNYTTQKLKTDIDLVNVPTYQPLTDAEKDEKKQLVRAVAKNNIVIAPEIIIEVEKIKDQVRQLIERKVGRTDKIEELVRDVVLNRWVKEGINLHRDKRDKCAFCGQDITNDRWHLLLQHFDEDSLRLERDLDNQIHFLESFKTQLEKGYDLAEESVYVSFVSRVRKYHEEYFVASKAIIAQLDKFINQLIIRKEQSLFEPLTFVDSPINVEPLHSLYLQYSKICEDSNEYTNNLQATQAEARRLLRYQVVYDFIKDIDHDAMVKRINELYAVYEKRKVDREKLEIDIKEKQQEILSLQLKLNDEENGAAKVNEYLNNYFGFKYLSLHAIKNEDGDAHYRFEVFRNEVKAYNLSEGECSLVAFCYFMAKLHDTQTDTVKPMVWIDDPISSLDNNHIFFVYSLINSELIQQDRYEQLFISTHNLDFFKYLKRLPGANKDLDKSERKRNYRFLLLNRIDEQSNLNLMPRFMIDYVTEFNFLFKQIYNCAQITNVTDDNYQLFYNFGNNARKFLELFLYYKYPDGTDELDKYTKFFNGKLLPAVLTMRINNEYSHLSGVFERGGTLTEVPEMKKVADLILKTIQRKDEEQYNALLRSIGVIE